MKATIGEIIVAFLLSALAAALTAVWGFAGLALLYGYLLSLSAKDVEPSPFLCPVGAVAMAVAVFVIVFRKVIHHGDPASRPSGK
jgi:hypothetical protein